MAISLIHVRQIDSTQMFLERHSKLIGCGVLADCQLSGRGQHGNTWHSALNAGLWLSAVLPVPSIHKGILLQRAASAAAELLGSLEMPIGLKWPNDLVAWKSGSLVKIGGIIGKATSNRVILGIGINIWSAPLIPDRIIAPACLVDICSTHKLALTTEELAIQILARWENLNIDYRPSFYWPQPGDLVQWKEGHGVCKNWLTDGRLAVQTATGIQILSVELSQLTTRV